MRAIELLLDDCVAICNKFEPLLLGTPTNTQADQIRQKLEQLISRVEIAAREAKSHGAFVAGNRERVNFRTRQERYRGIQSLNNIRSNTDRIVHKGKNVETELRRLLAKMDKMHPVTAIGLVGQEKVEKITETQAKGEKYEPNGIDAADQIGITCVVVTAIVKLVIEAMMSRLNNDGGSTTG